MSEKISESIFNQLRGNPINQIAGQLGIDKNKAESAVSLAVPLLISVLAQKTQKPDQAQDILALVKKSASVNEQDADSPTVPTESILKPDLLSGLGVLGNLVGTLTGKSTTENAGTSASSLLNSLLGSKQDQAEQGLAQVTGLSAQHVKQLLIFLAPVLLNHFGKLIASGKVQSSEALAQELRQEENEIKQKGGLSNSLLTSVLDQNGDGKLDVSDLISAGAKLFARK